MKQKTKRVADIQLYNELQTLTRDEVSAKYNVSPSTISYWQKALRKNTGFCTDCGEPLSVESKNKVRRCVKCAQLNGRKVKPRPGMEYIMNDVKTLGWSATGRKYGVSDNAVRKWVRQYEKEQNNMNYNGERARHGRDVTVIVRDVETGDISYYDSVKDCTAKTGFSITTIRHHMKHRTVYMQKYIILPGEEHDKYVNVELQLSKELDGAITRLTDTIPSLSFDKFCNALIRDWLSDQEKSKNITGSIYGKMK